MYVTSLKSLNMKFHFVTKRGTAAETALIDSGATENFINQTTLKRLGITPKNLSTPQVMRNVDGTTNQAGLITKYINLEVR
jgi:predicted aspartyl protease